MRAARNFTMGVTDSEGNEVRRSFKSGEDIPKSLEKEVDDALILEKVAKNNPNELTREQLMDLAGLNDEQVEEDEEVEVDEDFDEDEFREGLQEMTTKRELKEWAQEFYGVELEGTRQEMEDALVAHITGDDEDGEEG